ncbi:MAG: hypothetical protein ABFD90_01720 [Phycisphaerales bacterium]
MSGKERKKTPVLRAYELMRETLFRKTFVLAVHMIWFAVYGMFWLLFLPTEMEVGEFIYIWGGFFLPLALSAGIFGDDMASGRICTLVTKPFWPGTLYLYRLLGLSLQGAASILIAGGAVFLLDMLFGKGTPNSLGLWLFSTWLLFNACAALATTVSIVVPRSYNSLLVLLGAAAIYLLVDVLWGYWLEQGAAAMVRNVIRFAGLPFGLIHDLAKGDYGKYSLSVGKLGFVKSLACTVHCLILTTAYALAGIAILTRRQFSLHRD